ncbi:YchJ family protein [Microbacterium laevaniformans]|nr:YchJ family metal-binding protein [Microbacterium laevaniformans]
MSFGAASPPRGRRPPAASPCPCGGGAFAACCGPVLDGLAAATAEKLMRSRFTAFALGDASHLLASWHPATRPDRLELDDDLCWERLDIDETHGGVDDVRATVTFRASWWQRRTGACGVLTERSRFRRLDGRWLYVDGVVDPA